MVRKSKRLPVKYSQQTDNNTQSTRKIGKPSAASESDSDTSEVAGAVKSAPLWGELSVVDRRTLAQLAAAAERFRQSNDAWLAAVGNYVGTATDLMSAPPNAKSGDHAPIQSISAVSAWKSLAAFFLTNRDSNIDDARASIQACTLYWTQVPDNLIEMHEYHAGWSAADRKLLSRALGRLNSIADMCEHLASFKKGSEIPPFGVTAGVFLQGLRQYSELLARRNQEGQYIRSLMAGGDVFLCRDLPGRIVERGAQSVLSNLEPLLAMADVTIANLETVIAAGGSFARKGEKRPFYYHCPPHFVDVLSESGITCVTTANNHAGDFGPKALVEQIDLLNSVGLASVGSGRDAETAEQPVYIDADGIVVAVIAFETEAPRFAAGRTSAGVFHLPIDEHSIERLTPLVAEALWNAEVVVVSPHWGSNWRAAPSDAVRRLAHAMIDIGVHAVIGHSGHVLQGVEVYEGRPIIYDMGCLVVDRAEASALRQSGLFELRFDRTGIRRLAFRPLRLSSGTTQLARGNEARAICDRIVGLSAAIDADLRWRHEDDVLIIDLEPQTGNAEFDSIQRGAPSRVHQRGSIRLLGETKPDESSFLTYDVLPPGLGKTTGATMGGGLVVFGQRRAQRVRTGYGFLVEILFTCPDPRGRHWRASLTAQPIDGNGTKFQYRHPVSEGMWQSQVWDGDAFLKDAFVVRPPEDVRAGSYCLSWTLVDVASGRIWPAGQSRSPAGWVKLGTLEIRGDAPAGVAGIDWDTDLPWTPLTESDRSR